MMCHKKEYLISPNLNKARKILEFIRRDSHVDVWLVEDDIDLKDLTLQIEEVADAKWATTEEIRQMLKDGVFVDTIMLGFEKVLEEI